MPGGTILSGHHPVTPPAVCDMPPRPPSGFQAPVLWRVQGFGRQTVPAGSRYWWDNRERLPEGQVYVQLTVEGRILWRGQAEEREVPPGWLLLFRHGEASCYGRPPGEAGVYRCEWVGLIGAGLCEHWQLLQERFGCVVDPGGPRVRNALQRLMAVADPASRASPLAVSGAVHAFVLELFSALEDSRQVRSGSPVDRAIEQLLADPIGAGPLRRLARAHGVSREHLTRAFRTRFGQPPGRWLAAARLQRALELLAGTALPVPAVAAQSGLGSADTLVRQVRMATGRGPTAWRMGRPLV